MERGCSLEITIREDYISKSQCPTRHEGPTTRLTEATARFNFEPTMNILTLYSSLARGDPPPPPADSGGVWRVSHLLPIDLGRPADPSLTQKSLQAIVGHLSRGGGGGSSSSGSGAGPGVLRRRTAGRRAHRTLQSLLHTAGTGRMCYRRLHTAEVARKMCHVYGSP